jgi:rod shape-determining protein MreD
MIKVLVLFALSILMFVIDNFFMPFIGIGGVYPSMLLVFCILFSVQNGKWEGMWLGVFCGLLQDLFFTNVFGLNVITNMTVCLLAGVIGTNIFKDKKFLPVASCFALSFLKGVMIFASLYIIDINMSISRIFFVSVYNMVVAFFMYRSVYDLCQKDYMQIQWKF